MKYQTGVVLKTYTPSEVERITGVSTTLQRDWRRRGILPKGAAGKWTTLSLNDVIKATVRKALADFGFYPGSEIANDMASMAQVPTLAKLFSAPLACEFSGDPISERLQQSIKYAQMHDLGSGADGRYIITVIDPVTLKPTVYRVPTIAYTTHLVEENSTCIATVIDTHVIANLIEERGGLPILRVEVECKKD